MPELFDDLRRLGALKNARLGGEPSNRTLARKAGLAPETPGKWFGGGRLPRDAAALRTVVQEIRVEAERRGVLNEPVEGGSAETLARFLDPRRWEAALEAERRSRADGARVAAEREQARRALAAQETRERQAALPDRPRPVRSWTARRLGVHPAISGGPAGTAADFVLPRYVTRPHDTALWRHLRTVVAADRTTFVLLQGGSCTGKTRTAVEALHQAVPDDFELLFPADTAGLLAALAADALPPRGVLWLDEAQEYLAGPEGEAAAAALLRRLDGAGPLIVLATLWPDDEARLVAPAEARGARDPRRHTRDLLHQATPCLLPGTFAEDLEAVREAARQDPSLAEALRTGTGDITQILAA